MTSHNERLESAINDREWSELVTRWPHAVRQQVRLEVDDPFLTGEHQKLVSDGRRAEICYIMYRDRPDTGLLLHIKTIYPEGAYRLPTGGIHQGEQVVETLAREIMEETGLQVGTDARHVRVRAFLGVLAYDLAHYALRTSYAFATYHFLVEMPAGATLSPQDESELIAGWQWCTPAALPDVATTLEHIGQRASCWGDWGRYRALSHRFVARTLAE